MKNPMYKLLVLVLLVSIGFTAEAQRTKIAKNQIPDQINIYLKKHFPNNPVTKAAFDNHMVYKKYEITLKDKTSLEFSPAFEVTEIKSKWIFRSILTHQNWIKKSVKNGCGVNSTLTIRQMLTHLG